MVRLKIEERTPATLVTLMAQHNKLMIRIIDELLIKIQKHPEKHIHISVIEIEPSDLLAVFLNLALLTGLKA